MAKKRTRPYVFFTATILIILIYITAFLNINYLWNVYKKDVEKNMIIFSYDIEGYTNNLSNTLDNILASKHLAVNDIDQAAGFIKSFTYNQNKFSGIVLADADGSIVWQPGMDDFCQADCGHGVYPANQQNINEILSNPQAIRLLKGQLYITKDIVYQNKSIGKIIGVVCKSKLSYDINRILGNRASNLFVFDEKFNLVYDNNLKWNSFSESKKNNIKANLSKAAATNTNPKSIDGNMIISYDFNKITCFYNMPQLNCLTVAQVPIKNNTAFTVFIYQSKHHIKISIANFIAFNISTRLK